MRILRCITRMNLGGPAIQALMLSEELKKRNSWSTKLVAGFCPENEGKEFETKAVFCSMDNDFEITLTPRLAREVNLKKDWQTFKELCREILIFKPDIIHTHMSKAGFLGRLAAIIVGTFSKRPKLVHTFHGHVFEGYFGRWKSKLFIWLERFLARFTDVIVALSHRQKEDLFYKYKLTKDYDKIRIIPLGFDLNKLLELEPFRFDGSLTIGIVGRLTKIKNHKRFFQFVAELNKLIHCHAAIIGDGELRKELEQLAEQYPFAATFLGNIPYEAMSGIYSTLDIVVCSSDNEGTPVSIIEAMASGRLVVAWLVGGVWDLMGGYMYHNKRCHPQFMDHGIELLNAEETAIAVKECIDTGMYIDMIENAAAHVEYFYNKERLLTDIENLYHEICPSAVDDAKKLEKTKSGLAANSNRDK